MRNQRQERARSLGAAAAPKDEATPDSAPVRFFTQPWQLMPTTLITTFSIVLPFSFYRTASA